MKYPTGILQNLQTNRWHPISFRQAPMPGNAETGPAYRHKSVGHHTEGFDTLEQAQDWVKANPNCDDRGTIYAWDGEGTPAMVEWFT
jgi:hypothetical protein